MPCRLCWQVEADAPVAIYGEGKEHAMAVGITKMSTKVGSCFSMLLTWSDATLLTCAVCAAAAQKE